MDNLLFSKTIGSVYELKVHEQNSIGAWKEVRHFINIRKIVRVTEIFTIKNPDYFSFEIHFGGRDFIRFIHPDHAKTQEVLNSIIEVMGTN